MQFLNLVSTSDGETEILIIWDDETGDVRTHQHSRRFFGEKVLAFYQKRVNKKTVDAHQHTHTARSKPARHPSSAVAKRVEKMNELQREIFTRTRSIRHTAMETFLAIDHSSCVVVVALTILSTFALSCDEFT